MFDLFANGESPNFIFGQRCASAKHFLIFLKGVFRPLSILVRIQGCLLRGDYVHICKCHWEATARIINEQKPESVVANRMMSYRWELISLSKAQMRFEIVYKLRKQFVNGER